MDCLETNDDLRSRRLSLIDFASEDDFLLSSPSGDLPDVNSLGAVITKEDGEQKSIEQSEVAESRIDEKEDTLEHQQREQEPQLIPSLEPERVRKNGKYNLRKSLAWDSAFFTSAGVLDPEELSSMIEQGDKKEKHVLPVILEDIQKSSDSISTLESENRTLESIEGNLFEDVRASIQKSSGIIGEANSGMKAGSGRQEARKPPTSRTNLTSQNKIGDRSAAKKQTLQGSGRIMKHNSPQTHSGQQVKAVTKLPSSSTLLNKRPSNGHNLPTNKFDSAKSVAGKEVSVGVRNSALKHTQISTASKKEQMTSSLISANSSDNAGKSSLNPVRRKIECKASPSSGATRKTPSQIASKIKIHSFSSLMSRTKHSSGISPASSISEWSTESSSSSTPELQFNNSRASVHLISSKRVSVDRNASHDGNIRAVGPRTQVTGLQSQSVKKASAPSSIPPASTKPSGLRLPSPKIGFFDGVKASSIKSDVVVPGGLPKNGAGGINGAQNKTKPTKLQSVKVSIKSTNHSTQPNTSNTDLKSRKPNTVKISKGKELDEEVKELSSAGLDIAINDSEVPSESNQSSCALREKMSQENENDCNVRDAAIICTDGEPNKASEQCSDSC